MSLIKSISGIRGTIGGTPGEGLSPCDIVKFTAAYAAFIKQKSGDGPIVVGRDARVSGDMVNRLVTGTLVSMGCDVIDIGLATTPTTEIAVTGEKAAGGIIITASHNPGNWNALKLLNSEGEFLSKADGEEVLRRADAGEFSFAEADFMGKVTNKDYAQKHIDKVLALPLVDRQAVRNARFKVALDCVNSVGGIILPRLLEALGAEKISTLYGEPNGYFKHNPEPLEKNLGAIMQLMRENDMDVAFVVDPDVDRLAIICEDGTMFGEEYTLVSVADYVMSQCEKGAYAVSNLSSSRALSDIAQANGGFYEASAVGEVNVVEKMKQCGAVIGGEGNGGVIYPECHYGRDALVGIALFLTLLAKKGIKPSELKASLPQYYMSKQRMDLPEGTDVDALLAKAAEKYASERVTTIDGVKIDFPDKWVHLRKSNTEPIIRIYSEAKSQQIADSIGIEVMKMLAEN